MKLKLVKTLVITKLLISISEVFQQVYAGNVT